MDVSRSIPAGKIQKNEKHRETNSGHIKKKKKMATLPTQNEQSTLIGKCVNQTVYLKSSKLGASTAQRLVHVDSCYIMTTLLPHCNSYNQFSDREWCEADLASPIFSRSGTIN